MFGSSREFDCDFLDCKKRFDSMAGAKVAAVRYGDIVAFCAEHGSYLLAKGVNLRTLEQVRSELGIVVPVTSTPEQLHAEAEQAFIKSLK